MAKFSIGDIISSKPEYQGFDRVTVYKIDDRFYYVKILNGTVSIPIYVVEELYEKTT